MTVEVIIPWAGGCPYRDAALEWVMGRLGPCTLAPQPAGAWAKANSVTRAVEASSADIIVMHDADVWCDGLDRAIAEVQNGAPWTMPHERVHRLSPRGTEELLAGTDKPFHVLEHVEPPYRGIWGGGIVVLPRETYLSCPLDPRFVGWGCEDISWANALWFLAGEGWRGDADLFHLWHPPQERMTRQRGSAESHALAIRYRQARFRPGKMRALVDEFRGADAERTAQQAVQAHTSV